MKDLKVIGWRRRRLQMMKIKMMKNEDEESDQFTMNMQVNYILLLFISNEDMGVDEKAGKLVAFDRDHYDCDGDEKKKDEEAKKEKMQTDRKKMTVLRSQWKANKNFNAFHDLFI